MLGRRNGRRESQREAGEAAAAIAAAGDDETQGRRQLAVPLALELVRCNAFARGRIEATEDDPRIVVHKSRSGRRRLGGVAAVRGEL